MKCFSCKLKNNTTAEYFKAVDKTTIFYYLKNNISKIDLRVDYKKIKKDEILKQIYDKLNTYCGTNGFKTNYCYFIDLCKSLFSFHILIYLFDGTSLHKF